MKRETCEIKFKGTFNLFMYNCTQILIYQFSCNKIGVVILQINKDVKSETETTKLEFTFQINN